MGQTGTDVNPLPLQVETVYILQIRGFLYTLHDTIAVFLTKCIFQIAKSW